MTAEQVRQLIRAEPFTAFYLRTSDGRRVGVLNRDWVMISPLQTHVLVLQADGASDMLAIQSLVGAEFGPPAQPPLSA
jgi:hypothetical protein